MNNLSLLDLLSVIDDNYLKEIAKSVAQSNFKKISSELINKTIIDQFSSDLYSQQILISILAFCLIKQKDTDLVISLFNQYNFDNQNAIFPYLFLKAKMNLLLEKDKTKGKYKYSISDTLILFNELKIRYENVNDNEIALIELNSHFEYVSNFFNYLYGINNTDLKLKKVIFELKNCLTNLGFNEESYDLIKNLYVKYPDDLVVQFEMARDSILLGNSIMFNKVVDQMKVNQKKVADEGKNDLNEAYDIHIKYAEMLKILSKNEYEATKKCLSDIIKIETGNLVILNNICVMNIYENQISSFIEKISLIAVDSNNPTIKNNMEIISNYIKIR